MPIRRYGSQGSPQILSWFTQGSPRFPQISLMVHPSFPQDSSKVPPKAPPRSKRSSPGPVVKNAVGDEARRKKPKKEVATGQEHLPHQFADHRVIVGSDVVLEAKNLKPEYMGSNFPLLNKPKGARPVGGIYNWEDQKYDSAPTLNTDADDIYERCATTGYNSPVGRQNLALR